MKKISKEEKEIILFLREKGFNTYQIGEKINRGHQFVINCLKREGKYEKKQTEYNRKYFVNSEFFNKIDTEEKSYILGFLCADGHICKKTNRLRFQVATHDEDILYSIRLAMQSNNPIFKGEYNNPYTKSINKKCFKSILSINSVHIVNSLSFIPENKTYNLNSSVLEYIPKELVRHFLRGYFDGDGNVLYGIRYKSGIKYLIQIAGNKEFLENTFQKYFPSKNKMYFYKTSKQCYSWKLSSKENVEKFLEFLYKDSNIYLKRKFEVYKRAHIKPIELLEAPLFL